MTAFDWIQNPLGVVGWDPDNRSGLVEHRCGMRSVEEVLDCGFVTTTNIEGVVTGTTPATFNTAFRFDPVRGVGLNPGAMWTGGGYASNMNLQWRPDASVRMRRNGLANSHEGQLYLEVDARRCMPRLLGHVTLNGPPAPFPGRGSQAVNGSIGVWVRGRQASMSPPLFIFSNNAEWFFIPEGQDTHDAADSGPTAFNDFRDSFDDGFVRFSLHWRGGRSQAFILYYSSIHGKDVWVPVHLHNNARGMENGNFAYGMFGNNQTPAAGLTGSAQLSRGLERLSFQMRTNNDTFMDEVWIRNVQLCAKATTFSVAREWPRSVSAIGDSYSQVVMTNPWRAPDVPVTGFVARHIPVRSTKVSDGFGGSPRGGEVAYIPGNVPWAFVCSYGYQPEGSWAGNGGAGMIWGRAISRTHGSGGAKFLATFQASFDFRVDGRRVADWKRGAGTPYGEATARSNVTVMRGECYVSHGYMWICETVRGSGRLNTVEPAAFSAYRTSGNAPRWSGPVTLIADNFDAGNGADWVCLGPDSRGHECADNAPRLTQPMRLIDTTRADIMIIYGGYNDITHGNEGSCSHSASRMYPGLVHPRGVGGPDTNTWGGSIRLSEFQAANPELIAYAQTAFSIPSAPSSGFVLNATTNGPMLYTEWAWQRWIRAWMEEWPETRFIIVIPPWPGLSHIVTANGGVGHGACFAWERMATMWRSLPRQADTEWGAQFKGRIAILDMDAVHWGDPLFHSAPDRYDEWAQPTSVMGDDGVHPFTPRHVNALAANTLAAIDYWRNGGRESRIFAVPAPPLRRPRA